MKQEKRFLKPLAKYVSWNFKQNFLAVLVLSLLVALTPMLRLAHPWPYSPSLSPSCLVLLKILRDRLLVVSYFVVQGGKSPAPFGLQHRVGWGPLSRKGAFSSEERGIHYSSGSSFLSALPHGCPPRLRSGDRITCPCTAAGNRHGQRVSWTLAGLMWVWENRKYLEAS